MSLIMTNLSNFVLYNNLDKKDDDCSHLTLRMVEMLLKNGKWDIINVGEI